MTKSPRLLILMLVGGLGCTDDTTAATDEVGSTTDPGETAGDATDEGDSTGDTTGDTTGPEPEPCEFEWVTREPVLESPYVLLTPLRVDGDSVVVAHQTGPATQIDTRIIRAATADGAIQSSHDLQLHPGNDLSQSLALGPNGDSFLGSSDLGGDGAQVRRLTAQGDPSWVTNDPAAEFVIGLEVAPTGEVVYVSTSQVTDQDSDAKIVGLDPDDGSVRWEYSFGGEVAPNGFSLDHARALAVDDQGRKFIAMSQYVDWDTASPVIVALPPGDGGEPLWITELIDVPGRYVYARDLALGPEGMLVAIFQDFEGTQEFWVAALDGATGEVSWLVERDEIGLPTLTASYLGGAAVSADRVLITGSWTSEIEGEDVPQAFALGLDHEGGLVCLGTHDDYGPDFETFDYVWQPLDVGLGSDDAFYLAGLVIPYWNPMLPTDLLLAKVR